MPPRTKRDYLRQLVEGKNQWSRGLTDAEKALGFLGWHERGYLPHCDFPGLVQFLTFRLADSMPAARRGEWEHLLAIEDVREKRTKLEEYLDRGYGCCHLRQPAIASLAERSLLHFDRERYELLAWCVMPNHVHVLVADASLEIGAELEETCCFGGRGIGAPVSDPAPTQTEPRAGPEAGAPVAARILGHVYAR